MGRKRKEFMPEGDTKERILDTAARLFALRGFKSVTLQDIAKEVDIKIPSIYYHYSDKEALISDVLLRFEEIYQRQHDWLSEKNASAESVEEVIENLFNKEYMENMDPIARFGMAVVLREQHNHENAFRCVSQHLYAAGIKNVKDSFDLLVRKGLVPPSDTEALATLFMFCVMSGNELHLSEMADEEFLIDRTRAYRGLKKLITAALTTGSLSLADAL